MSELRYTLTGADRYGVFLEQRSDDAAALLRERDRLAEGVRRTSLYEVIDLDAVDPPARGTVTWCEGCRARAVLEDVGGESLCNACESAS